MSDLSPEQRDAIRAARDSIPILEGRQNFPNWQFRVKLSFNTLEQFVQIYTPDFQVSDALKMSIILPKLGSSLDDWLRATSISTPAILTNYAALISALEGKFINRSSTFIALQQLRVLKQTNSTVDSYAQRFDSLIIDIPKLDDEIKCHLFIGGLNSDLCARVRSYFAQQDSAMEYANVVNQATVLSLDNSSGSSSQSAPPKSNYASVTHLTAAEIRAQFESPLTLAGWYPTTLAGKLPGGDDGKPMRRFMEHNNICTFCRVSGHVRKNCTKA